MANPVRDFGVDANGDMAFANGDRVTVAGEDAVKQGISIRVKMYRGEVFCDQDIGIDYVNAVLIKNPDPLVVREMIKSEIASVPDVTAVTGAQLVVDSSRNGTISFTYRDVYSTSPIDDTVKVSA